MDDQYGHEKLSLLLHLLRWKSKVNLNFYVIVYSPQLTAEKGEKNAIATHS